jgi:hypothetical protein
VVALFLLACSEGGLLVEEPDLSLADTHASTSDEAGELEAGELGELDTLDGTDGAESGGGSDATLVAAGGTWRHASGPVAADWSAPEFDDRSWAQLVAPLGHGFEVASVVEPAAVHHLRASFELADPALVPGLTLQLRRDDGAIAYLNGTAILRTNMPSMGSGPNVAAASEASGLDAYRYHRAFASPDLLRVGTNVLAIELHDERSTPEDAVVDARLQVVDPTQPPDELEFRVRVVGYDGKYGPRNVGAIWLERGDGSFLRTLEVWGDVRREHLIAWRSSSNENDVDAITASTMPAGTTHGVAWDLRDLAGDGVAPGPYRLRVEYTEDDSNEGAPAGPTITMAFELGGAPDLLESPTSGSAQAYADLLLWAP